MSIVSKEEFEGIVRSVCDVYRVTPRLLLSRQRWQPLVEARQVAMTIVRKRGSTYSHAAKFFDRDHGTILYACRMIANRIEEDRFTRARWESLKHLAVEPMPGEEEVK
jgi:chromosomal replication initiation ATPase DnaA